jgi:hypothetical protein
MLVISRSRIVTNRVTEVTCDERRPPRAKGGRAHASSISEILFSPIPLSICMCQASQIEDVVVNAHVDA